MAKVPLQKIRVTGLRKHYKLLMQELHRKGVMEIVETPELIEHSLQRHEDHFGVFDLARIDFAIGLLEPYAVPGKKLEGLLSGGKLICSEAVAKDRLKNFSPRAESVLSTCEKLEESMVKTQNQEQKIHQRRAALAPYAKASLKMGQTFETEQTQTWVGVLSGSNVAECINELALISHLVDIHIFTKSSHQIFLRVTTLKSLAGRISSLFTEYDFSEAELVCEDASEKGKTVGEVLRILEEKELSCQKRYAESLTELKGLASELEELKILYDYNSWRKKKNDLQHRIFQSEYLFAFEGWMPAEACDHFSVWLQKIFVGEVSMDVIAPKEDEAVPAYMRNNALFRPFQAVTEMFGFPSMKDIDPTPWLTPFFFVFFGLCLSDVGYGLILVSLATFFLLFGKLPGLVKDALRLLLFSGGAAVLGGVFLGGYFGMTPEQAPSFLLAAEGSVLPFKGQFIDTMSKEGPMQLLILTVVLGIIQLLFGIVLDFFRRWGQGDRSGALMDSLPWFLFVSSLVAFGAWESLGLPQELCQKAALYAMILLIVTQSRTQKNWLLKPIVGALSLFNVTGYISDALSYSRVMALGLATGVIGFAMNMTAGILSGMMPSPFLGVLVATVVILFGHTLNFCLSLLGAFVHSGRLQFIEFFGKFFDGGGKKFKPFTRETGYLFFSSRS